MTSSNKALSNNATSQLLDKVGALAIIFGLFMLLNWINLDLGAAFKISFAWILLLLSAAYYFILGNYKLAGATTAVLVILLLFAAWIASPSPTATKAGLFLIIFAGGIGALVMKHGLEKSKQTLLKTPMSVLKAPLFLVNELLIVLGIEKSPVTEEKSIPKDDEPPKSE